MIEDERKRRANLLWDAALEGANKATPSIKSGFMNTIEPLIDELAILSTAIKSLSPLTDMRVRGTENTEKGSGVKCVCSEYQCNWHGMGNEVLTAPNPFEVGGTLYACPECKTVGSVMTACDEPGCWVGASCGTPTDAGYRQTCGKHRPNK